jgi:hypothetical protein
MASTNSLPITISADKVLLNELGLSVPLLEKLEAWANFSTLKANWFGNETKVISIKITLVKHEFFQQHFLDNPQDKWQISEDELIAVSKSASQLTQSVFLSVTQLINQGSVNTKHAPWIETDLQASIQQRLYEFLNQVALELGFDSIPFEGFAN